VADKWRGREGECEGERKGECETESHDTEGVEYKSKIGEANNPG